MYPYSQSKEERMSTQYGRDQREYIKFRDAEPNRFGEQKIKHDHYQDDQFKKDYDPTYEDELGMKHPYEHGGEENRWSDDLRSEAAHENYERKSSKKVKSVWPFFLVKIYHFFKPKKNR